MTSSLQIKDQRDAGEAALTLHEYFFARGDLNHRVDSAFIQSTYQLLIQLLPALNSPTDNFIREELSIPDGTSVLEGIRSLMKEVVPAESACAALDRALRCVAVLIRSGKGVNASQLERVQSALEPMWQFRSQGIRATVSAGH